MSFDSSRSSASKRSFDSKSSSRNSSKKKRVERDSNQKTLGVAWGANSPSASRSSSRNSPFSDFNSYMEEKNRKLRNQFHASSSSCSNVEKGLLHGISIFVDGFTIPSSQELRGYMLKYGGRFENYFSRHHVTHIICSNLPDSKIKNLRSFSRGLPVVKPTWLLDCVAANKVLNWIPYQLDQLTSETGNQLKLSSFYSLKSNLTFANVTSPSNPTSFHNNESSFFAGEDENMHGNENCEEVEELSSKLCHREVVTEEHRINVDEPQFIDSENDAFKESPLAKHSAQVDDELRHSKECSCIADGPEGKSEVTIETSYSLCLENKHKTLVDDNDTMENAHACENTHHSTLGDPDFVENYFKASRLHFIGTWRSRYRKRFSHLLTEFHHSNKNAIPHSSEAFIIHMDMDCFFVSVIIRNNPELQDRPVAVCYSDNPKGTAEISSANYPARDYGIRAGMFIREAKALCPHLITVPYNFEAYEIVADQFYNILHKHCKQVQALSCDEAFLDVSDINGVDPEHLTSKIRQEIAETTGCTASAGISVNLLMARLATRTAKPNGQCFIPFQKVDSFLNDLPVNTIPGIGYVLEEKLNNQQIQTCGQLRKLSKESLQRDFGRKTGNMLWNYSRGIDNRQIDAIKEPKSIGAEVNWAVRFNSLEDSQSFLVKLCQEVSMRLQESGMKGRTITLKVRKRKRHAPEPKKFMGCGDCENMSHSITVPMATNDIDVLQRITKQLFNQFHTDVKEVRGLGLLVSRLEMEEAKPGHRRNMLKSWLLSNSGNPRETVMTCEKLMTGKKFKNGNLDLGKQQIGGDGDCGTLIDSSPSHSLHKQSDISSGVNDVSILPPICNLDMEVIVGLPQQIISEIDEMYNGKLIPYMRNKRNTVKQRETALCSASGEEIDVKVGSSCHLKLWSDGFMEVSSRDSDLECSGSVASGKGNPCLRSSPTASDQQCLISKVVNPKSHLEMQPCSDTRGGSPMQHVATVCTRQIDLIPASLSQVDVSILGELPEELKNDILEKLPQHRTSNKSGHSADVSQRGNAIDDMDSMRTLSPHSRCHLWFGIPPKWVERFKDRECPILNILAELYYKTGSTNLLSSILWSMMSYLPLQDFYDDQWNEELSTFCDLLKEYIDLKIKSDIEEIYICFSLLRRLSSKSIFLLQAYDTVFTFLQASVGDNYGGHLRLSQ